MILAITAWILAGGMILGFWIGKKHIDSLMREIEALRQDNRILTEALLHDAGKPFTFSKIERKDSEGWFDFKREPEELPQVKQY